MGEIASETVRLDTRRGACPALLVRPAEPGVRPGVVIGQEATGPNRFIRAVACSLARAGHVVVVPDYYRGDGPPDAENYADIETLVRYMDGLDFGRATHDLVAGLAFLGARPDVDRARLAVWGYCTGATIALLAACVTPGLAAAVLFYPSQPRFEVHDLGRPVDPLDLLWNLGSDVLLLTGDADPVWPPDLTAETRRRLEHCGVPHAVRTYAGAGHAFCAPVPMFHHPQAERQAWSDALDHLASAFAAAP